MRRQPQVERRRDREDGERAGDDRGRAETLPVGPQRHERDREDDGVERRQQGLVAREVGNGRPRERDRRPGREREQTGESRDGERRRPHRDAREEERREQQRAADRVRQPVGRRDAPVLAPCERPAGRSYEENRDEPKAERRRRGEGPSPVHLGRPYPNRGLVRYGDAPLGQEGGRDWEEASAAATFQPSPANHEQPVQGMTGGARINGRE